MRLSSCSQCNFKARTASRRTALHSISKHERPAIGFRHRLLQWFPESSKCIFPMIHRRGGEMSTISSRSTGSVLPPATSHATGSGLDRKGVRESPLSTRKRSNKSESVESENTPAKVAKDGGEPSLVWPTRAHHYLRARAYLAHCPCRAPNSLTDAIKWPETSRIDEWIGARGPIGGVIDR